MTSASLGFTFTLLGGLVMAATQGQAASKKEAGPEKSTFAAALISSGPSQDLGAEASMYGWLVGAWDVEMIDFIENGSRQTQRGEWYFSWTLEGRAIQDVLIAPVRSKRDPGGPRLGNRYGVSIRVYDAREKLWRVTWINPVTGAHDELAGRKIGNDIVQTGTRPNGQRIRWVFTDIAANSCLWYGEALQADGLTWQREAEFHLQKRAAQ